MLTTYDLDEPRTCPAAGAVERDRVLAVPTAREVEVLRLIVRGLTNAVIASS